VGASREIPAGYERFFRALGYRIRSHRVDRKLSQEDMLSYGFSVRHWQMIEAGRPITMITLLRVAEAFELVPEELLTGLSHHLRRRRKPWSPSAMIHFRSAAPRIHGDLSARVSVHHFLKLRYRVCWTPKPGWTPEWETAFGAKPS